MEHAINYILQPKKLGNSNLTGGINCLPDSAYERMKATKQMFGKAGGRQGYHFVISLKPGEGTSKEMYEIAMQFAEQAFGGEYEAVVAVHTDKNHLHAHIVINSVNMVTGYKFQYNNGNWKYKFQPITNRLCKEYGLHITPAEYSREPKNMERPQWEREQTFSKWIEQDARFCALNAENTEHFIFLLEKQGFEVKKGEHIAVKVPGMKRFKRLDTISKDFGRENLEAMFQYGDASQAFPINHTMPLIPIRKTILTPYQRKCYARIYRLRLAEKKRFTYKSAYLYEQIRKMHELQEEYLVVVKYDVKSFVELVHLKVRLQRVDEELCKIQKEMYRDRASQKRDCKTAEDLVLFEASANDYRERLEKVKLQKKDNHKKLKAVERCLERDGSTLDAELEYRIPVGNMDELTEAARDEVPRNPHRQTKDLVVSQVISEDITDEIAADVGDRDTADVKLPANKADYMRMSVAEKVFCYPFDTKGIESAFEMVRAYFEKIDMDTGFHSVYEEAKLLSDYYEKQRAEEFIGERAERVIETMKLLGIDAGRMAEYSTDVLSEIFSFGDMEYFAGIKLFNRVIDRLEINMEQQKRYEVFDRIYTESMQEKKDERDRCRR